MTTTHKSRPVFIAAMQREIAGLVHGWRGDETLPGRKIHLYWNDDAVVACAGMGADRARLAVEAALALGPASELISVGWAGACIHRLRVGDVVWPDIVVDTRTGERFLPDRERGHTEGLEILATVAVPAGQTEKQRLSVSYFASAVDMEAAAVGRMARAQEIPFQAIKAISDAADFELPDLAQFTTPGGQFREAAFGLHVAMRPSLWKPVTAMARGSKLAARNLQSAMNEHIAQRRKRTL
jgi:adenosylhomocysteine nucleosidase